MIGTEMYKKEDVDKILNDLYDSYRRIGIKAMVDDDQETVHQMLSAAATVHIIQKDIAKLEPISIGINIL